MKMKLGKGIGGLKGLSARLFKNFFLSLSPLRNTIFYIIFLCCNLIIIIFALNLKLKIDVIKIINDKTYLL